MKSNDYGKMYFLIINLYLEPNSLEDDLRTFIWINHFYFAGLTNFTINENKNLQAIKSIDVFKGLINKINNSAYRIQFNTEVLEEKINNVAGNKYVLLTNGSGLRGYLLTRSRSKRVLSIIRIKTYRRYRIHLQNLLQRFQTFRIYLYCFWIKV